MSLGLRRRPTPNVSEGAGPPSLAGAMQTMPPPLWPKNEAQRQAREVAQREWNDAELAAKAAEKQRTEADWAARQQKQQKIEATAAEAANVWIAERDRLMAELENAQAARNRLSEQGTFDCSTVESAVASIHAQAVSSAAQLVVERAEGALAYHRKRQ